MEKFIGDAVMAVFGVPLLHEDDALRAVRAAAEMRDGLVVLNQELRRDYGTELQVRIGVNTGEVVTGHRGAARHRRRRQRRGPAGAGGGAGRDPARRARRCISPATRSRSSRWSRWR